MECGERRVEARGRAIERVDELGETPSFSLKFIAACGDTPDVGDPGHEQNAEREDERPRHVTTSDAFAEQTPEPAPPPAYFLTIGGSAGGKGVRVKSLLGSDQSLETAPATLLSLAMYVP
jgi:hypothetical protein